jgi:RHS repeat-associated protein
VGDDYEVTDGVVAKYYSAGSQRIALRVDGTLYYLLSDHLGSTALTADAAGNKISELRYTAWGETRYTWGSTPTRYHYTGQYSYTADFGLYFYNARWYDPSLGRFVQADTIVPASTQGTQAWDRYAYVNNSPVNYTDPSGHCSKSVNYEEGTLCYFQNMSWSERKAWLINFAKRNNLGN